MNITQFKEQLGSGGARPNQFEVQLLWPTGLQDAPNSEKQLLVTGAALPASTVNPAIIQYRGREIKMAGERIFDPWTITIANDSEFSLRKPFEHWMDNMNTKGNAAGDEANEAVWLKPSEYVAELQVTHLDRNDDELMTYTLHDAFPINMSEIALQYAQNDIIEEFTVTFQYQWYTVQS
jgi:hypothetical protein